MSKVKDVNLNWLAELLFGWPARWQWSQRFVFHNFRVRNHPRLPVSWNRVSESAIAAELQDARHVDAEIFRRFGCGISFLHCCSPVALDIAARAIVLILRPGSLVSS